MQQKDQSDFVYFKRLFNLFEFYLNSICERMLICVTQMCFLICFHAVFLCEIFRPIFLVINGNFLSLLPDVMLSVHDGPQWKQAELFFIYFLCYPWY